MQGLVEESEGKSLLGRPRDRWDITQWIANELGGRVLAGFIWLRESDSGQYVAQIPEPQHTNNKTYIKRSLCKTKYSGRVLLSHMCCSLKCT
jgi:DNA-binding PucR family transcriptional regulator